MPDTYDPILNLIIMTYGSDSDQWGAPNTNNNNTWIAQAVAGINTATITGVNYTLSNTQGAANEARRRIQLITSSGAQTAAVQIIIPSSQAGWWMFDNQATSGGFTVSVGINGGNTVNLPYARRTIVRTDGTTTVSMEPRLDQINVPTAFVDMNSQTISGVASPTLSSHAATRGYVLSVAAPPVNLLPTTTGDFSMGGYRIINMGAALNPNDAITLQGAQALVVAASLTGTTTAAANTFIGGPVSGGTGVLTQRAIVLADLTSQNIMPIQWTTMTTTSTATVGVGYMVNTASSPLALTTPSSPTAGNQFAFTDMTGSFNANPLTISSSDLIMGLPSPMLVNTANAGGILVYSGSTYGWRVA